MRNLIREYRKHKYYKNRAKRWKEFKKNHEEIECGFAKNSEWIWDKDCHNCSYDKDFFEKYGCMYIKDFENY